MTRTSVAKLLYSAKTGDGKAKSGFVDAATAQEALAKLVAAGLTDIQLHSEPAVAAQREDLAELSESDAERLAAFELRVRAKRGLGPVMAEVARRNWLWLAVDCVIFAWGWARGDAWLMSVALLLLAFPFGLSTWRYRHAGRYDGLVRACAVGDWPQAHRLLAMLRRGPQLANVQFDLDVREGCIRAAQGELASAAAGLEKWRGPLAEKSPGLFEARLAAVHSAGGDYAGFVELMRRAYEASSNDPSRRVDLALAEARFGDPDRAEELLNGVDLAALPAQGKPFIHWIRGSIDLRRARRASSELERAVSGFLENGTNPAVWTALAVCGGAYALSLAREGRKDEAKATLARVWPILKVHGDKPLLAMIAREIGP